MVRAFGHGMMGHGIDPSWWLAAQNNKRHACADLYFHSWKSALWEERDVAPSMVRVFSHGTMGHGIDPSWWLAAQNNKRHACADLYFHSWMLALWEERDVAASMVRAFGHGTMGHGIDPSWWPRTQNNKRHACADLCFHSWKSALWEERDVAPSMVRAFGHGTMGHGIDPSWWPRTQNNKKTCLC